MSYHTLQESALLPFHKALAMRCNGDVELMDKMTALHEIVPQSAVLPYATIDEPNADDVYMKNAQYEAITFTFHIWSESVSKLETYQIINSMKRALTRSPLEVEGRFFMGNFRFLGSSVFADQPGSELQHGILRVRAQIFQTKN